MKYETLNTLKSKIREGVELTKESSENYSIEASGKKICIFSWIHTVQAAKCAHEGNEGRLVIMSYFLIVPKYEQRLVHRCLIVRKVRGKKLSIELNNEGFKEEVKDYGIFVLISNVHKAPWEALRLYRDRNIIESSYRTLKSDLDSSRPRVWHTENARGKEVCRMIALGYRFYLQDALERVRTEGANGQRILKLGAR